MRVREKNDITQWCKFFLVGIIETAENGIKTFDNILKLQKEVEGKLQSLGGRANNALLMMEHLYQRPLLDVQKAKKITNLSAPSVYKLIEELEHLGIIQEITGGKRGKQYLFTSYVRLFQ